MNFLKLSFGSMSDGITSDKPFPDSIRNAVHCAELSIFDNTVIEYVKDHNRLTSGGNSTNDDLKYRVALPVKFEELSDYGKQLIKESADSIKSIKPLTSTQLTNFNIYKVPYNFNNDKYTTSSPVNNTNFTINKKLRKTLKKRK